MEIIDEVITGGSVDSIPHFSNKDECLKQDDLLDLLPVAVYVCDSEGTIKKYNRKATELWGRAPVIGDSKERFCGARKLYLPDGGHLPHDQSPVAFCLKDGMAVKEMELIIERPDLSRVTVLVSVTPISDESETINGALACLYDITARKKEERELERQRHELQDYVDNAAIGLHWVDEKGIIKWANKAELRMLGYTEEEYIGRHIAEFHADDLKIKDILERLSCNETLNQYEAVLRCKDGSTRTVQISSNVFREDGEFIHTRCFTVDITRQQQLYSSLRESEFRYKQLLKGLSAAVYTCDENGYITLYNEAAAELWGRAPEAGKELWCGSWKIYNTDGSPLDLDKCPMAVTLKEGRSVAGAEIIIERPDGSRRNVLPYPEPLFDESGKLIGAVNMLIDITGLKQTEQALRESEERFNIAANTAPVLIWMSDPLNWRYFFNRGWLEYTGRSLEQEVGMGWADNIHPEDLPRVMGIYESHFAEKKEYRMEYRLRRHDGVYRWMLSHGIPRYTPNGAFEGYIGTIIDVHEQKLHKEDLERCVAERTEELTVANMKLELSNRELEDFAYVASHDLQEPLRKIKAFGDILVNRYHNVLGEDGSDMIGRMQSASDRMKVLIDDLLSYSRVTKIADKGLVDASAVFDEVLNDLDTLIKEKDAEIRIEPLCPIKGNALQIRQLFQNLLSNALKFHKPGVPPVISITSRILPGDKVTFPLTQEELKQKFQLIEISDNGIGFEQQYAQKIFQVFQRLHGKSEYAGSGVGLSIVQKVVQNHNGYINAIGKPGEGAVFQLLFPVQQC